MAVQKTPTLSISTVVFTASISVVSSFIGSYISVSERISRIEERVESVKEDILEIKEDVRQIERTSTDLPILPPQEIPTHNEYGIHSNFYHDKKQTPKKSEKS